MTGISENGPVNILSIDSSARIEESISRKLAAILIGKIKRTTANTTIVKRDLATTPPPFVDSNWVSANFTPEDERTTMQQEKLAASDLLVKELQNADILVISAPLYNFSVPATLKAWIDMVARAKLTFQYTENAVEGLLFNKKAYVLIATGGVQVGSAMDYASDYLRHFLGFIGITDVSIIAADQLNMHAELSINQAMQSIEKAVA